jgi:hypothetical protein
MMNKLACCASVLLLSACALGSDAGAPAADMASAAPVASESLSIDKALSINQALSINTLLAYQASLHHVAAPELGKSLRTKAQPGFEAALRRAMLLGARRSAGDLGRAQIQLDGVLQSRALDAQYLKPLARMLAGHYAELLRQDAALDKLGAQLREARRRSEQLDEQLDALKNIERTLSAPQRK